VVGVVAHQDDVVAVDPGDALHDEAIAVARVARDDDRSDRRRDAEEQELVAVPQRRLHAVPRDAHAADHP
jgi:hypothetical protein